MADLLTAWRPGPPAAEASATVDFIWLHRWFGDGTQAMQDGCLLLAIFYWQYRRLPLPQRRKKAWQGNGLRDLGGQFGWQVSKTRRAIKALEARGLLRYQQRVTPLLDSQMLGAVKLTREATEVCRKLIKTHGAVTLPFVDDAAVAMKVTGFYFVTLIGQGVRRPADLAHFMHFSERRAHDYVLRLAADGLVVWQPSGTAVFVTAIDRSQYAARHGKDGWLVALRERHGRESEQWAERIHGRERAASAARWKKEADAARVRSRSSGRPRA